VSWRDASVFLQAYFGYKERFEIALVVELKNKTLKRDDVYVESF
jgi:hypothetical protein